MRGRTIDEDAYLMVGLYLYGPEKITAAFATEERADKVLARAREILTEMSFHKAGPDA